MNGVSPSIIKTGNRESVISFKTLGSLNIILKGEKIPASDFLKRRRIQDLLILLIINRQSLLRKEVIFNLFWEHYSERSKKDNLNTLIYRLKKLFGLNNSFLSIDRNSIALDPQSIVVDVDTFSEGIGKAEALENKGYYEEALQHSLSTLDMYQGDFFENITTSVPIIEEKLRIKHLYQTLLFRTLRLSVYSGYYRKALKIGQKLLSTDPCCEPAYRLTMEALAFLGNTSEVTRLYCSLEKNLHDKYKIVPDEKTCNLKNRLALGVNRTADEMLQEVSIFF